MKGKLSFGRKVLVLLFAVLALFSLLAGIGLPRLHKKAIADAPMYSIITVEWDEYSFDTSDTPDTLKDVFIVYGKNSESDTPVEITDKSLYEITIAGGYLRPNQGNDVTVTYTPSGAQATVTVSNVATAELTGVSIRVADGWTQKGGYWRKTVNEGNANSYDISAFVRTMSQATVFEHLVVTAQYAKASHEVKFDIENDTIVGTLTGESFVAATSSFSVGSQKISVEFGSSAAEKGEIVLNFEDIRVVSIDLVGWTQPANVRSDTYVEDLDLDGMSGSNYYIVPTFNSGEADAQYSVGVEVEGLLTPSAADLTRILGGGAKTYDKTLTIRYTGEGKDNVKPIEVLITNIQYVAPERIATRLSGTAAMQTARSEFVYDGLTVEFEYADGVYVDIPLNELKDVPGAVRVDHYNYKNGTTGSELTRQVQSAVLAINLTYPNTDSGTKTVSFNATVRINKVDPKKVSIPKLLYNGEENYSVITYSPDCYKTIVFAEEDEEIKELVDFSFLKRNAEGAFVTATSEEYSFDKASGKITFKSSGIFMMRVELLGGDSGDYNWADFLAANYGGNVARSSESVYILEYKNFALQVDKAPINVTLAYASGADRVYGWDWDGSARIANAETTQMNPTVKAFLRGGSGEEVTTLGTQGAADPLYSFYYYPYGGNPNDATTQAPKDVGTYYVFVKTDEEQSKAYREGVSDVVEFKITPAPLSGDIMQNIKYDGNAHSLGDFIKPSTFKYGEKYADVLTIAGGSVADTGKDGKSGYVHVKTYEATLQITNDNYKWDGSASKQLEVSFKITPLTLNVNTSVNGFVYGASGADPDATQSGDYSGFITFNAPKYYAVTGTTETEMTNANYAAWAAGSYKVYFPWDYAGVYAKLGDIVLKLNGTEITYTAATQDKVLFDTFTITRAELTKLSFSTTTALGIYKNAGYDITIPQWSTVLSELRNGDSVNDVLNIAVSGLLTDGTTTITTGISVDYANGIISVTEAGTYTVTVTMAGAKSGNYEWKDKTTAAVVSPVYTIERKVISFAAAGEADLSAIAYVYDGDAHAPVVSPVSGIGGITLSFGTSHTAIYNNSTNMLLTGAPSVAGSYYVLVSGFECADKIGSASYTYAVNFKLPDNCKILFTINSSALVIPTLKAGGDTVTEPYKKAAYNFADYLKNTDIGEFDGKFTEYLACLNITGANNLLNANTYTVSITPKTNYKWDTPNAANETKAINFTFIIEQKAITVVNWGSDQTYTGSALTFTATAGDLCAGDSVSLTVSFSGGINPTDAGTYTGTASIKTEGTAYSNYKIEGQTHDFKILKRQLNAPTATGSASSTFTGADFTRQYTFTDKENKTASFSLVTFSAVHTTPFGTAEPTATTAFNTSTGRFTYTNAGTYVVSFKLTDAAFKNYYFTDIDATAPETVTLDTDVITVLRKAIAAPAMGNGHTMQWTGSAVQPTFTGTTVTEGIYTISFSVEYGEWKNEGRETTLDSSKFIKRGFYFARVTMTSATVNGSDSQFYNFVWKENESDAIKDNISGLNYGELSEYDTVYDLMYAVINQQLEGFTFEITDYTFGDNGATWKALDFWGSDSYIKLVALDSYAGDRDELLANVQNTLAEEEATISVVFKNGGVAVGAAELSFGLPWNAGKYTVEVTITFPHEGTNYENLTFRTSLIFKNASGNAKTEKVLEVAKRTISQADVDFTNTDAVIYDGNAHTVTASYNGEWKKEGSATATELTITMQSKTDAGTHTLSIATLSNENDFVISATNAPEQELVINQRAVTIYGKNQGAASEVYGETLTFADLFTFGYAGASASDVAKQFVGTPSFSFKLVKDTVEYATNTRLSVGTYTVKLIFTATDDYFKDYTVTIGTNEEFEITKRAIEVTIDSAKATSVYRAAAVNLYNVYEATLKGAGSGNAIVDDVQSVITLSALLDGASVTQPYAKVGSYPVTCVLNTAEKGGNYALTFAENTYNYTITEARITIGALTGIDRTYNGSATAPLTSAPSATWTNTTANPVTWQIAKGETQPAADSEAWVAYMGFTVKNVADSGKYWLRATASNHGAAYKEFNVSITKKEVSVSLSFAICYGEANPEASDYLTTIEALRTRTTAFLIDGLVAGESRAVIGGTFSYTTNYTKGNPVGKYDLTLDVSGLTSDNYSFVVDATNCQLTVKKFVITVNINDPDSVTYHVADEAGNLTREALTYTITYPTQTYGAAFTALPDADASVFTLKTDAYLADRTKDVGVYPVYGVITTGEGAKASNYDVTFAGAWANEDAYKGKAGIYTVTPATIVTEFVGKDALYNETTQQLLEKYSATAVGTDATIKYFAVKNGTLQTIASESDWNAIVGSGTAVTQVPETIDVWHGFVYYCVTAKNNTTVYGVVEATIAQATNAVKTDFNFANGKTATTEADAPNAWIYGYGVAGGFDPNGDQKITEPEALFKRNTAGLTVELWRGLEKIGNANYVGSADVAGLFEELFGDRTSFTAGSYRLRISMAGTDNYTAFSKDYYFKVEKRALTVQAQDKHVTYGNAFTDFVFKSAGAGLVPNDNKGTMDTILQALNGEQLEFETTYVVGDYAGSAQTITVKNSARYESANYSLTFEAATLTVDKRAISIEIENKENFYNLKDYSGNDETKATLTFLLTGGSFYSADGKVMEGSRYRYDENADGSFFYNNQSVLRLKTDALKSSSGINTNIVNWSNGKNTTNLGYTIYAVWNEREDGRSYGEDYSITIEGSKKESGNGAIGAQDTANNAGKYTIKPTVMGIRAKAGSKTNWYYDGEQKVLEYEAIGDSTVEIISYYTDKNGVRSKNAPKNAGEYTVTFEADNPNYITQGGFSVPMSINKATVYVKPIPITVGADDKGNALPDEMAWVQYGTTIAANGAANGSLFGGLQIKYIFVLGDDRTEISGTADNAQIQALIAKEGANWTTGTILYDTASYKPTTSNKTGDSENYIHIYYKSGLTSNNFDIKSTDSPSIGNLFVNARKITATVKGFDASGNALSGLANNYATASYSGEEQQLALNAAVNAHLADFFLLSDNWSGDSGVKLADLGLSLEITGARTIGQYLMKASKGGSTTAENFDITFVENAYYKITPAPLNVYVQVRDAHKGLSGEFTYVAANKVYRDNAFQVIYGNTANFTVAYDGFVGGETFSSIQNIGEVVNRTGYTLNAGSYDTSSAWVNNVGAYVVTYQAAENALAFTNYAITYVPTQFNVAKRTVVASTTSQEYREIEEGKYPSEGASGKTLVAAITFANADAVGVSSLPSVSSGYLPTLGNGNYQYTLSYSGKRFDGTTTTTPNVAGNYDVTITFANTSNYTFANNSRTYKLTGDKQFVITKKPIGLSWNESSMTNFSELTQSEKVRKVSAYISEIMEFGTAGFVRQYRDEASVAKTDTVPTSAYDFDNGLTFNVYGVGTYRLVVQLKSSARNNYVLTSAAQDDTVTLTLIVSTEQVSLLIESMKGWEFNGYDESLNLPVVKVDGAINTNSPISYAQIGFKYDDAALAGYKDRSFTSLDGLSITESSFTESIPAHAGVYVVCALYRETGQRAYYLFEVTPLAVTSPSLNPNDENGTYVGKLLTMEIAVTEGVTVTAENCYILPNGNDILVQTVNAGTYPITFSLASSDYVWASTETVTDEETQTIVKDWVVAVGQDEITGLAVTGDGANGTIVYGGSFEPTASATFFGRIHYAYREVVAGKTPDEVTGWGTKPTSAKQYWVRAMTDDTENYLGATAYATFTINKATLTVTPYATITYGDAFRPNGGVGYGYDVTGFLRGDGRSVIQGSVTYGIPLAPDMSVTAEGVQLSVNVSGLSATNYDFVAADGVLMVTRKSIVVTIGNADAYFTLEVNADGASKSVAGSALVGDDTLDDLAIVLKVVDENDEAVTAGALAGSYRITSETTQTKNYNVTYRDGIFTVKSLPVSVSIAANGGEYDMTAKGATVDTATSNVTGYNKETVAAQLTSQITFRYTGTMMNGADYVSTEAPVNAGSYTATIMGVSSNFTLLNNTSKSFTISRRTVDSLVTIPSKPYDGGNVVVPDVPESEYYRVSIGEYRNAGTHGVILTLNDKYNTAWDNTTQDTCVIDFIITPADNAVETPLAIEGWTYGSAANEPSFAAKYASMYTFRYYDVNGKRLEGVPSNAGSYSVTVSAAGTLNWNALPESARVPFTIEKCAIAAPSLVIVTEGDDKNDTYTGDSLRIQVTGYDHLLMSMNYAGSSVVNGNEVTLLAVNAGGYGVTFALADASNYTWQYGEGVSLDDEGNASLAWTIARKKVALPTDNKRTLIVNGSILTYLPEGFDESIMGIKDNRSGYGGKFTAKVWLLDPDNYEWAEGDLTELPYEFMIVGSNTVFIVVMCTVSGVAAIAAGAACAQAILNKRRKRRVEENMDKMDEKSNGDDNAASEQEAATESAGGKE